MQSLARRRTDDGETLVEIVVAVAIMGLAAVAIMAGLQVSATVSGTDRRQSTAETAVRNFAEQIQATVDGGGYSDTASYSFSPPSGFAATIVAGTAQCLTAASAKSGSPVWAACPQSGNVQKMQLQVATTDGKVKERLWVFVRRPCLTGGGSC